MTRSTPSLALPTEGRAASLAASEAPPPRCLRGVLAAAWGVTGQLAFVVAPAALLLRAAVRGLAAADLDPWQWALAAATVLLLGYVQGHRGFQRGYAPFVAARAAHLARHPNAWHGIAAPLHVCGLVGATPRRRLRTALLLAVMPVLAFLVGRLPSPYRAIVDLGVAFGLAWGALSIVVYAARAAAGRVPAVPLSLPAPRR
jgi:hypothetical protein